MRKLLLIAVAGAAAELIDGTLGMGFGVTASTVLIVLAGLGPAQASAIVHTAELGTTLASGVSHWKFGNVDWGVVLRLGVPGATGAFLGATLLSHMSTAVAAPVTAGILCVLGVVLVAKFARGASAPPPMKQPYNPVFLAMLSLGRTEPRRVIGAVNTAEFLVTLAATLGFALGMWHDLVANAVAVAGLLLGGVIAAPLAAWLVSRVNPFLLGGVVGTSLVFLNSPKVLALMEFSDRTVLGIRLLILLGGLSLSVVGVWRSTRRGVGGGPTAGEREPAMATA